MNFKQVDKKYRPIPFWSWNAKLDTEETKRQAALMDRAGIGGYFMHARGGLLTDYMGDEWFENVKAACEEGKSRGMHPWAYDENGWPSGFGNNLVNGLGDEYRQKLLRRLPKDAAPDRDGEHLIAEIGGYRYYYIVNPFYIDIMDKKVVAKFIEVSYEVYKKRVGNAVEGFFTDEPQINNLTPTYPWSGILPETFKARYGYDIVPVINRLFEEDGDFMQTRFDFWKLVTDLFSESYFKQIGDWCVKNGYGFTGHCLGEENLHSCMHTSGAVMPHYEYFTIPGMDWLGRPIFDCLTPKQLGSAAAQLGKKQVLSETYACTGHNVSHDELKRDYEWMMVRGVNLLCTHLEGYTTTGLRKRDHPTAMYYQQPWWEDAKLFFDAMSRIGMLIAEGEITPDTLLIHNQSTAWVLYGGEPLGACPELDRYNKALLDCMKKLEEKHILYHLGDETLMERHGKVEGGKLIVGKMAYTRVVLPPHRVLFPSTEKLLEEFRAQGGEIVDADRIEVNPVCEINDLTYTTRKFPDFDMHYFVNSTDKTVTAHIEVGNLVLNPVTGETSPFCGEHTFGAYESLVLIDTGAAREKAPKARKKKPLDLSGKWKVTQMSENTLVLDRPDYYFDGELIAEHGYVLDVLPRINELRRPVKLKEVFTFEVKKLPNEKKVWLVSETPEKFTFTVNGKKLAGTDCGMFRDIGYRKIDLEGSLVLGTNKLEIEATVSQSEKTYEHLANSWGFETMKNTLSYDFEIEQVLIAGEFGTETVGAREELPIDAYRTPTSPIITAAPKNVDLAKMDECGFTEFAGTLTVSREFTVEDKNLELSFEKTGINAVEITVNGRYVDTKMFAPYTVDLTPYLEKGKNEITLTLRTNLRNVEGPMHLAEGENTFIWPGQFFRESNVFYHAAGKGESCHDVLPQWCDGYCLVHQQLKGKK